METLVRTDLEQAISDGLKDGHVQRESFDPMEVKEGQRCLERLGVDAVVVLELLDGTQGVRGRRQRDVQVFPSGYPDVF